MEEFLTLEEMKERIIECSFYITIHMGRKEYEKVEVQRDRLNKLIDLILKSNYKK